MLVDEVGQPPVADRPRRGWPVPPLAQNPDSDMPGTRHATPLRCLSLLITRIASNRPLQSPPASTATGPPRLVTASPVPRLGDPPTSSCQFLLPGRRETGHDTPVDSILASSVLDGLVRHT